MILDYKLQTLCYAITAIFVAAGTCISVYYILDITTHHFLLSLVTTLLFAFVLIFKEYAKMQSSKSDGDFRPIDSKRKLIRFSLSVFVSLVCAIGVEALSVAAVVSYALETTDNHFVAIKLMVLWAVILALLNAPIDFAFYWNCIRKYFQLPCDTRSIRLFTSKNKKRIVAFFNISIFSSSTLICYRTVIAFISVFHFEHAIIEIIVGLIIGLFSFYANQCLLHQTFHEIDAHFFNLNRYPRLNILLKIRADQWVYEISAICYAVSLILPLLSRLNEVVFSRYLSLEWQIVGAILVGTIMILSYYLLTKNYLTRFDQQRPEVSYNAHR